MGEGGCEWERVRVGVWERVRVGVWERVCGRGRERVRVGVWEREREGESGCVGEGERG